MGAKMKITTHVLDGRRLGQFADLKTLTAAEVVTEAIAGGYVSGKKELILANVEGVLQSMAAGVSKDGNGRKVDGFLSLQPSLKCKLDDVCDPVSLANCKAKLLVRMLNEAAIDTSDWSFTIEGATGTLVITSITTGEVVGACVIGEAIDINGEDLADASVAWALADGTKSGTVAAAKLTKSATRLTIASDGLTGITSEDAEKAIVFTVTSGTKKAIKSATLKAAA